MIKQFGLIEIDLFNHAVRRGNGEWYSGYNRHNRETFELALIAVAATSQERGAALAAFDSDLYRSSRRMSRAQRSACRRR